MSGEWRKKWDFWGLGDTEERERVRCGLHVVHSPRPKQSQIIPHKREITKTSYMIVVS